MQARDNALYRNKSLVYETNTYLWYIFKSSLYTYLIRKCGPKVCSIVANPFLHFHSDPIYDELDSTQNYI